MKPGSLIAIVFLEILSLCHLLRVVFRLDFQVAGYFVPLWMSLAAFLFCGALAALLFIEQRKRT